MQDPVLRGAV